MKNTQSMKFTFLHQEQFIARVVAEQSAVSALLLHMPWQQHTFTCKSCRA